jgi:PAS domain S-box-containing protein
MTDSRPIVILNAHGDGAERQALSRAMRQAGFEVREAGTGAEALRLAAPPTALVLLDARLPDLSGHEVCRRLRADPATAAVPVVLLSCAGAPEAAAAPDAGTHMPPAELSALVAALTRGRLAAGEWQALCDAVADGLALLGPSGAVLRCNRALAELAGRPFAELVGRRLDEVLPAELAAAAAAVLRGGARNGRGESVEAAAGGRWFCLTAVPAPGSGGPQPQTVLVVTDVTQHRRAEQALQEADRRKDEFLALLSHELRGPLAPLRNALHLLRQRPAEADGVGRLCDLAERQVQQLARLVDDLLDVSRIARGKLELRPEPVDAVRVAADALETVRPQVEARGQRLTVQLPPGPVPLEADAGRLVQVLVNLLTNAAKYTPAGGEITFSAAAPDGAVVFRVRDTGVGLAPEVLPRVFELFFQAEPGAHGGLGIGLSLVRGLVEMHGGTAEATSDGPGRGCEFVVRLPAAAGAPGVRPTAPWTAPAPGPGRLRVLVVDDDVDGAESMALLVRLWGHEVCVAHDGPAALRLAAQGLPQAAVLDIALPGVDGYEVARRLRQLPELRGALVVALTGYGQEEDRRRAFEAGFDHHLTKPVDPELLGELLAARAQRLAPP